MNIGLQNIGEAFFSQLSTYGTSTAAPLSLILDTGAYGGRVNVEVWVKSSGAADFIVYGSKDGTNYRKTDTITLSSAGEAHRGYNNAYRYIKVETSAANNNEIEIVSSR